MITEQDNEELYQWTKGLMEKALSYQKAFEDIKADIDKLHNTASEIGKNIENRGTLYYAILEFADKYGSHNTGDYFKHDSLKVGKELQ